MTWQIISGLYSILPTFIISKGHNSKKKKLNQNFLQICISNIYILYNYKVSKISIEQFHRSCDDKKKKQKKNTQKNKKPAQDWRSKGLHPLQLVGWGIITCTFVNPLCSCIAFFNSMMFFSKNWQKTSIVQVSCIYKSLKSSIHLMHFFYGNKFNEICVQNFEVY